METIFYCDKGHRCDGLTCLTCDNETLRAEVERLKTEQGEALADQRRALCAEHDKDLMELKRVRKVAAEEVERLTGELAAVRREREMATPYCPTCGSCGEPECCPPSKCKHTICYYGKDYIKDYEIQKEMLNAALARIKALEELLPGLTFQVHSYGQDEIGHYVLLRVDAGWWTAFQHAGEVRGGGHETTGCATSENPEGLGGTP